MTHNESEEMRMIPLCGQKLERPSFFTGNSARKHINFTVIFSGPHRRIYELSLGLDSSCMKKHQIFYHHHSTVDE